MVPCANEVQRFVGVFWDYWPEGQSDFVTARSFDQLCQDLGLATQRDAWPDWFGDASRTKTNQVYFLALHMASGTTASFKAWMTGWDSGARPFGESAVTERRVMVFAGNWVELLHRL